MVAAVAHPLIIFRLNTSVGTFAFNLLLCDYDKHKKFHFHRFRHRRLRRRRRQHCRRPTSNIGVRPKFYFLFWCLKCWCCCLCDCHLQLPSPSTIMLTRVVFLSLCQSFFFFLFFWRTICLWLHNHIANAQCILDGSFVCTPYSRYVMLLMWVPPRKTHCFSTNELNSQSNEVFHACRKLFAYHIT